MGNNKKTWRLAAAVLFAIMAFIYFVNVVRFAGYTVKYWDFFGPYYLTRTFFTLLTTAVCVMLAVLLFMEKDADHKWKPYLFLWYLAITVMSSFVALLFNLYYGIFSAMSILYLLVSIAAKLVAVLWVLSLNGMVKVLSMDKIRRFWYAPAAAFLVSEILNKFLGMIYDLVNGYAIADSFLKGVFYFVLGFIVALVEAGAISSLMAVLIFEDKADLADFKKATEKVSETAKTLSDSVGSSINNSKSKPAQKSGVAPVFMNGGNGQQDPANMVTNSAVTTDMPVQAATPEQPQIVGYDPMTGAPVYAETANNADSGNSNQ